MTEIQRNVFDKITTTIYDDAVVGGIPFLMGLVATKELFCTDMLRIFNEWRGTVISVAYVGFTPDLLREDEYIMPLSLVICKTHVRRCGIDTQSKIR